MNRKGISLVELIAVIAIVALLAIIIYPNITKVLNNFKDSTTEMQKSSIVEGAKSYVAYNVGKTIFTTDSEDAVEVTLQTLYDGGYIDGEFKNKETGKYYDLNNSKVMIEYEGNDYKYTVNLVDKE